MNKKSKPASLDCSWYLNNEEIEYNKFGRFLSRFNAGLHLIGYVRGNPTTLLN